MRADVVDYRRRYRLRVGGVDDSRCLLVQDGERAFADRRGSPTTLEMLSATAGDGLIAAIIILAMSFGLIVPKMAIDYFGDRVARLKGP